MNLYNIAIPAGATLELVSNLIVLRIIMLDGFEGGCFLCLPT
jgi:hypothetical protein